MCTHATYMIVFNTDLFNLSTSAFLKKNAISHILVQVRNIIFYLILHVTFTSSPVFFSKMATTKGSLVLSIISHILIGYHENEN